MKTIYRIQQNFKGGAWKNIYAPCDSKSQDEIYFKGTCAFNGWKCRLLQNRKVIAQKGE